MSLKPDQERVKNLLSETVTLLIKNGLTYKSEMKVEAVIGVTIDRECFIVHINEHLKNPNAPKAESPDLEVSDEAPPGMRDRERNAERRRQAAAAAKKQPPSNSEVFVDLTGRESPSPNRHGRAQPASPRSQRFSSPGTPNRPGYATFGSPRTPTNRQMTPGRFRTPPSPYSPQMRGRFISPQQARGPYAPRQQYSPMQLGSSPARRALNLNNAMPPPVRPPRHASPLRTRRTANGDVVIVLDDPNNSSPPPNQRVLGQMVTSADPEPLTIQPVTIEPEASPSAPETTATESSSTSPPPTSAESPPRPAPAGSASPPSATSPRAGTPPKSPDATKELEGSSSPSTMVDTPALTETEDSLDDSLSRLASGIADLQRAKVRASSDSAPGTPKSVSSPSGRSGPSSPPTASSRSSPPPVANISALEEMAKSTVEELQKTAPPSSSKTNAPRSSSDSNADEGPAISVMSIEGNFSGYNSLGSFHTVKKPPPDDTDDDGAPPAKRRALSPSRGDSETPSSDSDNRNGDVKGDQAISILHEQFDIKPSLKETTTSVLETHSLTKTKDNLSTWQVRELLESHIVTPVLRKQESNVTAFRIFWRGDTDEVKAAWKDIVPRRRELDDLVAKEKNLSFFISSITAENAPAASFPCVGYWIVTRNPAFDKEAFMERMRSAGRGAELKMVLKADGGSMDEFGGLCLMVKDYGDGMVQRHVTESSQHAGVGNHPTVRFVLREKFFEHMLKNAMKQLRPASFAASLEKVV